MQEINRLKRDKAEIEKYRMKLLKNGNQLLAYKMQQKIEYIEECIQEMLEKQAA